MGIAKLSKRTAIIGSAIAVAAVGGGIAFAAYTATGTGSGTAASDAKQDLTVTVSSATGLYPGNSVPLSGVIKNPNHYAINYDSVVATTIVGPPTCNTGAALVFSPASSVYVYGDQTGQPVSYGSLKMTNDANDDCASATFTITIKLDGKSAA